MATADRGNDVFGSDLALTDCVLCGRRTGFSRGTIGAGRAITERPDSRTVRYFKKFVGNQSSALFWAVQFVQKWIRGNAGCPNQQIGLECQTITQLHSLVRDALDRSTHQKFDATLCQLLARVHAELWTELRQDHIRGFDQNNA